MKRIVANLLMLLADRLERAARSIEGYQSGSTSQVFRDEMMAAMREVNSKSGFCKNVDIKTRGGKHIECIILSNEFLNELLAQSGIKINWTRV